MEIKDSVCVYCGTETQDACCGEVHHEERVRLWLGDCLELMKNIPDRSIDLVLTDPPYGTTACKWDTIIPFEPMWTELKRITKLNAAIALFGNEPFSSALRVSNMKMFKYDWIWEKSMPTGMATSSFMPMKYHETISIFVKKGKPTYNKILMERSESGKIRAKSPISGSTNTSNHINMGHQVAKQYNPNLVNPKSILKFGSVPNTPKGSKMHPTQKPVALLEYLIKTYTLEGETVLDFTMGSGSTGVAAKNLDRKFIGIEKEKKYFDIAVKRILEE